MSDKAILKDKTVVPVDDVLEWAEKFEKENRILAQTYTKDGKLISTVFLGLDHNFGAGNPLWFETMIFPSDSWGEIDCDRYETYDEALEGHKRMVEKYA